MKKASLQLNEAELNLMLVSLEEFSGSGMANHIAAARTLLEKMTQAYGTFMEEEHLFEEYRLCRCCGGQVLVQFYASDRAFNYAFPAICLACRPVTHQCPRQNFKTITR